tara:strand:+ start:1033 stop:1620 length:588 start_codon:yes stop_codon:yes gene_type:complete
MKNIFKKKHVAWNKISNEIGAEYKKGSFFKSDVLEFNHRESIITLDYYTVSTGNSAITYTRMRSPLTNKNSFYFNIYRENIFSSIRKKFGMEDIIIEDKFFDDKFIIQSNDKDKIKIILKDDKLKKLIHSQPKISYKIKDNKGWFSRYFPKGEDELYFECPMVIKDEKLLKNLFEMFSRFLDLLIQIDSGSLTND